MRKITRTVAALLLAFGATASLAAEPAVQPGTATAVLRADTPGPTVHRYIFGQFIEHLGRGVYDGIWVGPKSPIPNVRGYRADMITALRELRVPMIRWPGGCFAEYYHWRDGIGPAAKRPVRLNAKWGNVEETNAYGTHEFMNMAEMVGADAFIQANVGTGTPSEMTDWLEYMTSASNSTLANERRANGRVQPWKVPVIGIGNELVNCGGSMRPAYAADVYKQFQTFLRGTNVPMKIATGPFEDGYDWTETMMREAGAKMDALALHYYTVPGGHQLKREAVSASEDEWAEALALAGRMDDLIVSHTAIMDRFDPQKRVALSVDEWGPWYRDATPDRTPFTFQLTLRDAMIAAVTFNIFVQHADRVRVAAIAQMVNVGGSMLFTQGARMVKTPMYHAFHMYRDFQDGVRLPLDIRSASFRRGEFEVKTVQGSAVRGKDGRIHVALVNLDPTQPTSVSLQISGAAGGRSDATILTADRIDAHNTFDAPNRVVPAPFTSFTMTGSTLQTVLPPHALVVINL